LADLVAPSRRRPSGAKGRGQPSRRDFPCPLRYVAAAMNWVDGVVLAVLALSAIVALFRGLVQEVLGIGAWVGAAFAALALQPVLSPFLLEAVGNALDRRRHRPRGRLLGGSAGPEGRHPPWSRGGCRTSRSAGRIARSGWCSLGRGAFLWSSPTSWAAWSCPEPERWPDPVRKRGPCGGRRRRAVVMEKLPPDYRARLVAPPVPARPRASTIWSPAVAETGRENPPTAQRRTFHPPLGRPTTTSSTRSAASSASGTPRTRRR
jgi:membrane protein required for colicin V production